MQILQLLNAKFMWLIKIKNKAAKENKNGNCIKNLLTLENKNLYIAGKLRGLEPAR